MAAAQTPLTGARKAAIVMLALGEGRSAEVFKYLQEHEVEALAREVAAAGKVPSDVGEAVLAEFRDMTDAADQIATGSVEQARRLLEQSVGPEAARRIIDRVITSFKATAGFASLEKANPQQLSKFILGEHPQTIAVILARLNATTGRILGLELKKVRYLRSLSFIQGTAVNALRTSILFMMLYLIWDRQISVGQFFALWIYSFFIFGPLQELGNVITA